MKSATILISETGEFSRIVHAPSEKDIEIQCGEGEVVYWDTVDGSQKYLKDGVVTDRPDMDVDDSDRTIPVNTDVVIEGIPEGAMVVAPGFEGTVDDGSIEWQSALPDVYQISIFLFPYKQKVVQVEVTEA